MLVPCPKLLSSNGESAFMKGGEIDCVAQAEALIEEVHAFYGQPIYAGLEAGIARKKRLFCMVFPVVRMVVRSRLANMVMLVTVLLGYRALRRPDPGAEVFQYGLSTNNIVSFGRLNECLQGGAQTNVSLNGRPASLTERLAVVGYLPAVWLAACALRRKHHAQALPHVQAVIALAAHLFHTHLPLPESVRVVCVASDHSPVCMGLLSVAAREGCKTCYIQHAPVTEYFPPLNYDLSILYDKASAQAYGRAAKRRGTSFDANIVYLPPFPNEFEKTHAGEPPYKIGICLSFLPEIDALDRLTEQLLADASVKKVVFRRHPRCTLDLSRLTRHQAASEQPKGENVNAFFDQVDIVLVPSSGVAIEALHRGRPTFYTPGVDDLPTDYYNFVAEGILPEFGPAVLSGRRPLLAFFTSDWEKRFERYDETVHRSISAARDGVLKAFSRLL